MIANFAICWNISKIPTGNRLDYGDNQQGRLVDCMEEISLKSRRTLRDFMQSPCTDLAMVRGEDIVRTLGRPGERGRNACARNQSAYTGFPRKSALSQRKSAVCCEATNRPV